MAGIFAVLAHAFSVALAALGRSGSLTRTRIYIGIAAVHVRLAVRPVFVGAFIHPGLAMQLNRPTWEQPL